MGFRDYLAVLWRRKVVASLALVLVFATAVVLSVRQTPIYEASARLIIEPSQSVFQGNSTSYIDPARIETEIQVVQSEPVAAKVRGRLGSAPGVSASIVGTTAVINISARDTSARRAAAIANAYAETYIEYRRERVVENLATATRELQAKLDEIDKQIAEADERAAALPPRPDRIPVQTPEQQALRNQRAAFKEKLDEIDVESATPNGGALLATRASAPTSPVLPQTTRNAGLGLLAGAVLGIALAFVAEQLDDSIKTRDDVERVDPDLPVLGVIPRVPGWRSAAEARLVTQADPKSVTSEAYRALRTSIRFFGVDRTLRTIQITSPSAGEGKTTTTANLAVTLSQTGQRVVIVSCDLRRPRAHDFFGLSNRVGLTSVLLGVVPLPAALQRVPGEERLAVLPSGPLPPNPSELLSSARTAELLAALASQFDTVLVDCPPVLPVTDAAVLSGRVDGTLVVVSARSTHRKALRRALEALRQVGAPVIGTVLNGAAPEGGYAYQYGTYQPDRRSRTSAPSNGNGKVASEERKEPTRGEPAPQTEPEPPRSSLS